MKDLVVDVAIIGAGTAGMGAARAAARHTPSIAMIEGGAYGTTCARVGCMPSKLLIAAADAVHEIQKAHQFGIEVGPPRVDGAKVMARVRSERDRFVGFVLNSIEEDFPAVTKLRGHARFLDDHTLEVGGGAIVKADRIVIATGSRPVAPRPWIEALGDRLIYNDDVFDWRDLPESVVVFGGGVIGLELAQALHRLGVRIRLFGKDGAVGPLSDPQVRDYAARTFTAAMPFDPNADVREVSREGEAVRIRYLDRDGSEKIERFQWLLAATGRAPNVDKLGLENTTLPLDARGVPLFSRTTGQIGASHVFIAGDANAEVALLHEAADEGRIAGDNAGRFPDVRERPRRVGISVTFSDPQIAMAGLSLREIEARGFDYEAGEVSFENQGRSRVMLKNKGLLRVYGQHGTGLFLGAEMIGPAAEHLAHLLSWAAQAGLTVQEMIDSPFYHPVVEEGLRTALRNLNRKLRMGPIPVEQCLDCGPGA